MSILEGTLEALEKLAHEEACTRDQIAAIESAAKALHFIRSTGRMDAFLDYLRTFDAGPELAMRVEQTFGSMPEAMAWLQAQQDPPYGATVEVANTPYLVARQRTDKWFLVPAPPPLQEPEDEP
ncbi:MAG TPA: hypothetical protein VLQ93_05855 [Myxococcaceae bacterium]|nr:hypothetical protein [Myxococcaceae bacterium]